MFISKMFFKTKMLKFMPKAFYRLPVKCVAVHAM